MKIIKPNSLIQLDALRSNCDIVWLTGAGGSGKTYIACAYNSMDILEDPKFKAVYVRKNVSQFFATGGIADTLEEIYPLIKEGKRPPKMPIGTIVQTPTKMGAYFKNGASLKFMQVADESPQKLKDQWKGVQANRIFIDEVDAFNYETPFYILTRNRGEKGKKQQLVMLQNPERECFARTFLGTNWNGIVGAGYIDSEGNVIESMNGAVVYMFNTTGKMDGWVFGKTKEEVYERCQEPINVLLKKNKNIKMSYKDLILSMVFYSFSMFDNDSLDASYAAKLISSVASGSMAMNNWNVSTQDSKNEDGEELTIKRADIEKLFVSNHKWSGNIRITCDPASTGVDNMVLCAWDDYHLFDIEIIQRIEAADLEQPIRRFMNKHGAKNHQLSLDIQKYEHLKRPFAGARFFWGTGKCSNLGAKSFVRIKDEASYRMVQLLKSGIFTIESKYLSAEYKHQKTKNRNLTYLEELSEEAKMFRFTLGEYDRIKVTGKNDMGHGLSGKSPDLLDNFVIHVGTKIYDVYRLLSSIGIDQQTNTSSYKNIRYSDKYRRDNKNVGSEMKYEDYNPTREINFLDVENEKPKNNGFSSISMTDFLNSKFTML